MGTEFLEIESVLGCVELVTNLLHKVRVLVEQTNLV